jgi:membrane-associated phospholipid phosphatase
MITQMITQHYWVQSIHTAVKGRARFKVKWLYGDKYLKKHLEYRLSKSKFIAQVSASHLTGNILVIFQPNKSLEFITNLIQEVVLDCRKQVAINLEISSYIHPELENCQSQQVDNILDKNEIYQHQIFTLPASLGLINLSLNKADIYSSTISSEINLIKKSSSEQDKYQNQENTSLNKQKQINIASFLSSDFISTREKSKQLKKLNTRNNLTSLGIFALLSSTALIHFSGYDKGILLAIKKIHSPFLNQIMIAITSLCEPLALIAVCSAFSILIPHHHRRYIITNLTTAAVGVISLNYLLKEVFTRSRPSLWEHLVDVGHYSFPSGHAMVSLVIYGFIGYILAKEYPQYKKQIFAATTLLILTIGFSRLYLGVHWATDVIAGYAVGLFWLMTCTRSLELANTKS